MGRISVTDAQRLELLKVIIKALLRNPNMVKRDGCSATEVANYALRVLDNLVY